MKTILLLSSLLVLGLSMAGQSLKGTVGAELRVRTFRGDGMLRTGAKWGSPSPLQKSALQSVVDTELAFAKTAEKTGTRPAFLAFIAEDGVLYRPAAVNGKKWLLEHPLPPSEKRPLLAWYPSYAEVALAGDMGITFGPWEYKEDRSDQNPVACGHFATVWKKQADGGWKFVIDHGISLPQPKTPITLWQLPANYTPKPWKPTTVDLEAARAALLNHDRT
ncbi:MAG: YybH family protein, partial [Pyrinomonadaceae bacterium]